MIYKDSVYILTLFPGNPFPVPPKLSVIFVELWSSSFVVFPLMTVTLRIVSRPSGKLSRKPSMSFDIFIGRKCRLKMNYECKVRWSETIFYGHNKVNWQKTTWKIHLFLSFFNKKLMKLKPIATNKCFLALNYLHSM